MIVILKEMTVAIVSLSAAITPVDSSLFFRLQ